MLFLCYFFEAEIRYLRYYAYFCKVEYISRQEIYSVNKKNRVGRTKWVHLTLRSVSNMNPHELNRTTSRSFYTNCHAEVEWQHKNFVI